MDYDEGKKVHCASCTVRCIGALVRHAWCIALRKKKTAEHAFLACSVNGITMNCMTSLEQLSGEYHKERHDEHQERLSSFCRVWIISKLQTGGKFISRLLSEL